MSEGQTAKYKTPQEALSAITMYFIAYDTKPEKGASRDTAHLFKVLGAFEHLQSTGSLRLLQNAGGRIINRNFLNWAREEVGAERIDNMLGALAELDEFEHAKNNFIFDVIHTVPVPMRLYYMSRFYAECPAFQEQPLEGQMFTRVRMLPYLKEPGQALKEFKAILDSQDFDALREQYDLIVEALRYLSDDERRGLIPDLMRSRFFNKLERGDRQAVFISNYALPVSFDDTPRTKPSHAFNQHGDALHIYMRWTYFNILMTFGANKPLQIEDDGHPRDLNRRQILLMLGDLPSTSRAKTIRDVAGFFERVAAEHKVSEGVMRSVQQTTAQIRGCFPEAFK